MSDPVAQTPLARARALQADGQLEAALAAYGEALAADPDHLEALNDRAIALHALGRLEDAGADLDRVLVLRPGLAVTLANRASLRADQGRLDEALADYDAALATQPGLPIARAGRARVFWALGRAAEALADCDAVLAGGLGGAWLHNLRGLVLVALGRPAEALAAYDAALALDDAFVDALGNRGVLLTELGREAEACAALDQALACAPRDARLRYNRVLARRVTPNDPQLAALRALAADEAALPEDGRIHLHFALAKALGDIGETRASIDELLIANRLKRAVTAYDEAGLMAALDLIRRIFDTPLLTADRGLGDPTQVPVFIIGMPRSGTTLVEQILASHPQVFPAGESDAFSRAMLELGEAVGPRPWRRIGERYRGQTLPLAPTAKRITDKTPDNFRFAGLIHLALPRARFIHVRRDPLDTCLSCFSKLFGADLPYAYDLAELGRYHRAYEAMMAHWRAVLPPGVMLEVAYEDVVADLEGQARAILAHCALDWDPRCLAFHQTERWVRTASATQVRRPIYATSVGRWRGHETALAPLIEALDGR